MFFHWDWRKLFVISGFYCISELSFELKSFFLLSAILYLGDGCLVKYAQHPPVIQTIVGNGRQRSSDCSQCEGRAKGTKILAPMAVANSPDGSYYVGDADFIRRVGPEGNISNVLRLA